MIVASSADRCDGLTGTCPDGVSDAGPTVPASDISARLFTAPARLCPRTSSGSTVAKSTFDLPQALCADTLRPHHQILHTSVPHRDQRRQLLVYLTLEVLIEEVGDRDPKQLGNPGQQSGARVATATGSQVREVRSSDPDARFLQRLSGAVIAMQPSRGLSDERCFWRSLI